jgi:carbamate kinase
VVDKDLTAAALAEHLDADLLVVLTDVAGVMRRFGAADQELIREINVSDLRPQDFPAGSMRPKLAACVEFVRNTGNPARIGRLEDAVALVAGLAGTTVHPWRGTAERRC